MATVLDHRPRLRRPAAAIITPHPSWPAWYDESDHEGAMGAEGPEIRGAIGNGGINAYRILRDVASEILTTSDLGCVLDHCGRLVQDLLQADACSVALLDEDAGVLVPLLMMASGRSTPMASLPLELANGRMRAAIREGRSLVVANSMVLDGDAPLPLAETQSALNAMLIPLPLGQDLPGILWVGRIHGEPFTAEDQGLAETLAALVALGIRGTKAFVLAREAVSR